MSIDIFKDKDLTLNKIKKRDTKETFIVIKDCNKTLEIENVKTSEKSSINKIDLLDTYEIIGW